MNQYLQLFQTQRALIEGHSPAFMNAHREEAAEAFSRLGFPTRKVERYRYTDVEAAFAPNYGLNLGAATVEPDVPASVLARYATLADVNADAITALNTMLAQDITVVHVPAGVRKENPVQLTSKLQSTAPLMQNRRVLVVVEEGASLQLLLGSRAEAGQDFLTTLVTEVFVGEGAEVEIYDVENTHDRCHRFHQLYAEVAAGAHFTHAAFTLASGTNRNQTDVRLVGEGADVNLLGCAITDGNQHVDNNTLIDHRAPGCVSRELYKYVAEQQSTAAFAGRVLVRQEAQQTDSIERNANLVCTDEARIWTQPMLEIYADDVKCSHGSTVGQLNAEALFYMRQRGISEAEARMLLKQAFASEVIDALPLVELQPRLHALVERRFRNCEECRLCR